MLNTTLSKIVDRSKMPRNWTDIFGIWIFHRNLFRFRFSFQPNDPCFEKNIFCWTRPKGESDDGTSSKNQTEFRLNFQDLCFYIDDGGTIQNLFFQNDPFLNENLCHQISHPNLSSQLSFLMQVK